jgi:hypothetical protein
MKKTGRAIPRLTTHPTEPPEQNNTSTSTRDNSTDMDPNARYQAQNQQANTHNKSRSCYNISNALQGKAYHLHKHAGDKISRTPGKVKHPDKYIHPPQHNHPLLIIA